MMDIESPLDTSDTHTGPLIEPATVSMLLPMLVICAGSVLASLDLFVVNLAFSAIGKSYPSAPPGVLSWIISGYSVAFAALLVPAGRMADRFGRRRVFRLGMAIFAISSAACAGAPGILTLIAGRIAQGGGAALMVPTSLGLLLHAYPRSRHGRMMGIWVACGSLAASLGPVLGGLLVDIDWRWIFLINLPVAVPALWFARRIPETPLAPGPVPDLLGSALLLAGIATLVAAISSAGDHAGGRPATEILLVSFALLGWFVRRCGTALNPALDLQVFRSPAFTAASVGMAVFYTGFAMMLLGCMLFLIQIWHWSASEAGFGFMMGPATAAITAVVIGRSHFAARTMAIIGGLFFMAAGLWWSALLGTEHLYVSRFLPGVILSGIAAGVTQTGLLAGGTAALAPSAYGAGAGVLNTTRQIGAAIGAAAFIAIVGVGQHAGDYHTVWILIAVSGSIAAVSGFTLARPSDRKTAIVGQ